MFEKRMLQVVERSVHCAGKARTGAGRWHIRAKEIGKDLHVSLRGGLIQANPKGIPTDRSQVKACFARVGHQRMLTFAD